VTLRLNMGPGQHMATGWINVEAIQRDNHPPADILLTCKDPSRALYSALVDYGIDEPAGSVDRIYAGHCTEHIDQRDLFVVMSDWFNVLRPGGELGICQPDFYKALQYWKDGLIGLTDLMRHGDVGDVWPEDRWEDWYRNGEQDSWAMHSWNSIPERVHGLLRAVGFVVEAREPTREGMAGWPLTGFGGAQLACVGTKP